MLFLDFIFGYLHRGTEKLCEFKSLDQCIPYFDRLDYCSVLCNEHLFCFCFEILIRVCFMFRISCIRLLLLEITRIFNCLLATACMFMDLGCLSPLL